MNKEVVIVINEPFDFELGEGSENKDLRGIILGVCLGPDKKNWRGEYVLIRLDKPFRWEGNIVKELIASPRYEKTNIKDIGHKTLTVGIACVKPEAKIEIGKKFQPEDVKYSFIGHIKAKEVSH